MVKGPAASYSIDWSQQPLDAGFRVIAYYIAAYDEIATRIDVKIGDEQFNVHLRSDYPVKPQAGAQIKGSDDLLTPSSGIEGCLNVKVSKVALIAALKELISDLEGHETVDNFPPLEALPLKTEWKS